MPSERFVRISRQNQICLPIAMLRAVGSPPFVKISVDNGRLILTPSAMSSLDAIQDAFRQLGITPAILAEAKAIKARRQS